MLLQELYIGSMDLTQLFSQSSLELNENNYTHTTEITHANYAYLLLSSVVTLVVAAGPPPTLV